MFSSESSQSSGSSAPSTESQFSRPSSLTGLLLLRSMNFGHARLHRWGLQAAGIQPGDKVLDVGCGGGKALARILKATRREVAGVDHSPEAVETSRRVNRGAVASGRLRVLEASVETLPFRDGFFDVVTAFETTYFWPDLQAGLIEIHRVLAPGGRLVVTNEYADRAAAGRWVARLHMNVPDAQVLASLAYEAGFLTVDVGTHPHHGWLRLVAAR
ncbi:class I SAM-dependent methyltransferase [Actinomyces viscosus]|uniref:Rebeccamycin O-methyltransferase n=1 Tax=Actinomyces viscosus TaxID=1656 RepID=A0A3S4VD83_ACTVI|nr:class I SAM-dependent methyltransferase [Actinomyces viscosus]TFH53881.1 class I SAM-dependent methyltransferase [Actinomyces viscosus]VEI14982.1 Rebeccamycin O-methyltransferase [Actinomyces viscosus]